MIFQDVCRDFLAYIRHERGFTDRTCTTYSDWLSTYRRWCDAQGYAPSLAERFNVAALRRYLYSMSQRQLRPRTIGSAFSPLRALGVYLVEQGAIPESPLTQIKLPQKDAPNRPVVSTEEVLALLDACERLRTSRRRTMAKAILLSLALCGIRFAELLDLKITDIRHDLGTMTIRQGKGQKARTLYPAPAVMTAMAEWIRERQTIGTKGNQLKHDWLWAFDTQRRMGEVGARSLLEEVKAVAGYAGRKNIVPHAFRRFFATSLAGASGLQAAQRALGHSDLKTTLMYLSSADDAARAMQTLDQVIIVPPPDREPRRSEQEPERPGPKRQRADLVRRMRRSS